MHHCGTLRSLGAASIHTLRSFYNVVKEHRDIPAFINNFDHAAFFVGVWNRDDRTARDMGDVHPGS